MPPLKHVSSLMLSASSVAVTSKHLIFVDRVQNCGEEPCVFFLTPFVLLSQDAFWVLVQICEKYLPGYYSPGLVRHTTPVRAEMGLFSRI